MAHAVHPPCPGILPAEDRHRLPKHTKHDHKHLRDLAGRCMGHDDISSQTVDGSLQRQSTKIYKRTYKSHGQAGTQHIFHHISVQSCKILFFQPEDLISADHIKPAYKKRQSL